MATPTEICDKCGQHLPCKEKCPYCAHAAPCEVKRPHDGVSQYQEHQHARCSGNSEIDSHWKTGTPQRYFPPSVVHVGSLVGGNFMPTAQGAGHAHVSPPNIGTVPATVVTQGTEPPGDFPPELLTQPPEFDDGNAVYNEKGERIR